jgi:hypothetical protein
MKMALVELASHFEKFSIMHSKVKYKFKIRQNPTVWY